MKAKLPILATLLATVASLQAAPVVVYMEKETGREHHYLVPEADQRVLLDEKYQQENHVVPDTGEYMAVRIAKQSMVVRDPQYGVEVVIPLSLEDGEKFYRVPFAEHAPGDFNQLVSVQYGWRMRLYPVTALKIAQVEITGHASVDDENTNFCYYSSFLTGFQKILGFSNGTQTCVPFLLTGTLTNSNFETKDGMQCAIYGSNTVNMTLVPRVTKQLALAEEDVVDEATGISYTPGSIAYGTYQVVQYLESLGYNPAPTPAPVVKE